jgi:two-component system alkaline phosphatase synthesis response regulator PhoP
MIFYPSMGLIFILVKFNSSMKKKDIRILLVDDEPDVIEIIKYNLDQEGYNVKTASNGKEALKKAQKNTPHLIIMDVMMPEMDGIEACEHLRSDTTFNDTIIMFLTARGEDYSYVAAFDAGADDYVTKPIKPKIILSKVKALLRRLKKVEVNQDKIQVGKLIIDKEQYEVTHKGKNLFPAQKRIRTPLPFGFQTRQGGQKRKNHGNRLGKRSGGWR